MIRKNRRCNMDDCTSFQKQLKQDFVGKRVFVFSVPNMMVGKLNRVQNNILILNNAKVINFLGLKRNFYKQVEIPLGWVDRVGIR